MLRQRLRTRTSPAALLGRVVVIVFALALVWYGLMTLLLALKVSPATVESISGYRTVYDELAGTSASDVRDSTTRLIVGLAGLAALLVFGFLALKEIPRPYLARRTVTATARSSPP